MSHIYDALKQASLEHPKPQQPGAPSERPVEVRQVSAVPQTKKPPARGLTSLFHANPDENFRLWMEEYFPGASLSREDAIRQFLAMPPESRIQTFVDDNQPTDKPIKPETPAVAVKEPTNGSRLVDTSTAKTGHRSEWSPKLITDASSNSQSNRSRKVKWFIAGAICSVLGLLIVKFLWATPMRNVLKHATSPIALAQSSIPSPQTAAVAPQSENRSGTPGQLENESTAGHIESLSVGCAQTQPCIRIDTLGEVRVPKLSVLTHPDRLVIDFQGVSYSPTKRLLAVERGSVKDVRVGVDGEGNPANTRVVVDLVTKCQYELHSLTDTFVLNLYPDEATTQPE